MMGGTKLERRVEDAEQATGSVVTEQRRRVEGAVPIRLPTEAQRLEASTQAAVDSTRDLSRGSATLRRFLSSALARSRRSEQAEAMFGIAARGYERPATVYTTVDEARSSQSEGRQRMEGALGAERMAERPAFPDDEEARLENQQAVDWLNTRVSQGFMTREFLGEALYSRFTESPPIAVALSPGEYWLDRQLGHEIAGCYLPGTNIISITPLFIGTEDNELKVIAHEQLHYASYLGGGGTIRWRDEAGNPGFLQAGAWSIHEGATELVAQHLVRANGHEPTRVAYQYETAVCFALEQVVGEAEFRQAYLTGDFTRVRELADARLGAGTFDALMGFQTPAEAFSLIMQKVSAAGIDFQSWETNPIMQMCYEGIAAERLR